MGEYPFIWIRFRLILFPSFLYLSGTPEENSPKERPFYRVAYVFSVFRCIALVLHPLVADK